jgi:D-alanine-D-alanine ligase
MTIAILADRISREAASREDELDTVVQVECIESALRALGHTVHRVRFSANLDAVKSSLYADGPDLVFNLVEDELLAGHAVLFLEQSGLRFSGCGSVAAVLSADKELCKRILGPALAASGALFPASPCLRSGADFNQAIPYIVKARHCDASIGMNADAVQHFSDLETLSTHIKQCEAEHGIEFFAEAYIEGREFNIGFLNGLVLPPAEIIFEGYKDGQARIVDYDAKWNEQSHGYHHTPRSFVFSDADSELLTTLRKITADCCEVLGIQEYARVDFRVGHDNTVYVLEVNTNPGLSPDAGFFAACQQAGLDYSAMLKHILAAAICSRPGANNEQTMDYTGSGAGI